MTDIIQVKCGFDGSSSAGLCVKSTKDTLGEAIELTASDGDVHTLGILVNNPALNAVAHVAISGYVLAVALEAIVPYAMVCPGAGGKVRPSAEAATCIGRYIPAMQGTANGPDAAADELIRIKLFDNKSFIVAA